MMLNSNLTKENKYFEFRNDILHVEEVSIPELAKSTKTPFYVYSAGAIEDSYSALSNSLRKLRHSLYFSVKSNSNVAVLRVLARLGAGMDVVSRGEYLRARKAGVPGEKIVFSGVGKTSEEMTLALDQGIRQFNVESLPELRQLNLVASRLGRKAPVSIRVNPDVDARTHKKIVTGKIENKFGIPITQAEKIYEESRDLNFISIVGVDVHIGSQITDLMPFKKAFSKIAKLIFSLRSVGHNITRVDVGGGLGISYSRNQIAPISPDDFAKTLVSIFGGMDLEIQVEPGRFISGNAGLLISSVIYLKEGTDHNFLIIDAGMNDLIRPALYDARHEFIPVLWSSDQDSNIKVDVVGPICESSDVFSRKLVLPRLGSGDLIAIYSAGAYGAVMASEYNTRPLIPELIVKENRSSIIRSRPDILETINRDQIPYWLR